MTLSMGIYTHCGQQVERKFLCNSTKKWHMIFYRLITHSFDWEIINSVKFKKTVTVCQNCFLACQMAATFLGLQKSFFFFEMWRIFKVSE